MTRFRLLSLLLPLLFAVHVQAQSAGVYVDIGPCMAMEVDEERYACYDLLEEQMRAAEQREVDLPVVSIERNARSQQTSHQANDEPEVMETSISDFGRETVSASRNRENTARVLETDDGEKELVDLVARLDGKVPNQWEITLESGQVWYQINSKRFRLREGMQVRIYPSPFGGSFRLSASNMNGFIQVRRIQ